jgi:hypothetical protein
MGNTALTDRPTASGVRPVLLEGAKVHVTSGPYEGRMAYVVGHTFASDGDYLQFNTAGHPKRMFAKVERYLLKTRDSRAERISATPDEVTPLSDIDGWARGAAPEEAEGGEGFENQKIKAANEAAMKAAEEDDEED